METVTCDCCGSSNYRVVYQKPDRLFFPDEFFQVVECCECGLGFVNPRPMPDEMSKYYPQAFYDEFTENEEQHQRRYVEEAKYLQQLEWNGTPPLLLDVGCARGDFPRHMRKQGWLVEGVEPFGDLHTLSDFPLYRCWFPELPVVEPMYDAVTAWAVLEHVHNPGAYFEKAAQILKSGGLFIFLVTNFQSVSSRYLFWEDVPRHLYFFTASTVRRYLERNGFALEQIDYSKKIYSMAPRFWLHYILKRLQGQQLVWPTPDTYRQFLQKWDLSRNRYSLLRYGLVAPLSLADLMLMPLVERWQMLRHTYGIVVYVARKT